MRTRNPSAHPKNAKPIQQGKRLRSLREMTCLSRRAFSRKHGIPLGTLQNWEEGRYGELSSETANRLLGCFSSENVFVSYEWLMQGVGSRPHTTFEAQKKEQLKQVRKATAEKGNSIAEELKVFHELNPGSMDFIVPNEAMMPCFEVGDLVAGPRYFGDDLVKLKGRCCIIQKQNGETLVRMLEKGTQKDRYDLIAFHAKFKPQKNETLFSAAPIVWVRKLQALNIS